MEDPMVNMFGTFGFNNKGIELISRQGLRSLQDLVQLSDVQIAEVFKGLRYSSCPVDPVQAGAGRTPAQQAAAQAAATPIADQAVFPILACQRVMALRHWADYRALRGDEATLVMFTPATLLEWMSRLSDLDEEKAKGTDHPLPCSLKSMTNWWTWKETMLTGQVRGTALFTPLTYVIRKELPPDAKALAKIAEYNNINNNLVATVLLEGPRYKKDNKKLYNLLKTLLIEGSIWPFIQPYNAKTDGRAPWIAITK